MTSLLKPLKVPVHELRERGIRTASQLLLPVYYDGERIELQFRIDILAVDATNLIHVAQVITYPKRSGKYLGPLINFNLVDLRHGICRLVQGEPPSVSPVSSVVRTLVST